MSNKQFISNLSATYADVRKLDVKKINLKGKNILEYIDENKTIILDERGTLANDELDIWMSNISTDEDGNIIVREYPQKFEISIEDMSLTQKSTLLSAVKVENNQVLGADDAHLMFFETNALTDGSSMFYRSLLESFSGDLSSLVYGPNMFMYTSLESFSGDLSNLITGSYMFCFTTLRSFRADLNNLANGTGMFYNSALNWFGGNLSSLTNGHSMFRNCSNLTAFNDDMGNLTNGSWMFSFNTRLISFSADLSSLTNGSQMFYETPLESFSSSLSSLTNGSQMFTSCKLDAQSVANIIHFIPQRDAKPTSTTGDGNISIGIGIANTEEAKQAFAEELDCIDWADLNKEFDDKNWAVEWQFNGEASTFDLRSPSPSTAVFTKLEEVIMPTDENVLKPHYQYTSQDGSKFYNIHWYHDSNTNNEGYDYFESLEEAIASYGVIAK